MGLVQEAWEKSRKTYGYRRITIWIQQNKGISINHKAVLRLMNKMNIRSVARKRKPHKKMSQLDIYHRYENVLDRDFTATKPNQKWVTDITYIRTQQGWAYLSVIKDLFDGFEDVVVLNASYNAPCCPQRQTGTTLTDLSRMSEKEVVYQQAQDHAPACSISTTLAGLPSPTIVLFPIKIGNLDQPAKSIHSDNIY